MPLCNEREHERDDGLPSLYCTRMTINRVETRFYFLRYFVYEGEHI